MGLDSLCWVVVHRAEERRGGRKGKAGMGNCKRLTARINEGVLDGSLSLSLSLLFTSFSTLWNLKPFSFLGALLAGQSITISTLGTNLYYNRPPTA